MSAKGRKEKNKRALFVMEVNTESIAHITCDLPIGTEGQHHNPV